MENELRFYLGLIKGTLVEHEDPDTGEMKPAFVPSYLVTATLLPTGATELTVNTTNISEKLDYILEAYDEDMCLKANPEVRLTNLMVV